MPNIKLHLPFEAYQGSKPYIFVSYAHKDGGIVFPQIEALHKCGYRLWYDEGIDPGNEWADEIALALENASWFLVFLSRNAVKSKNVTNEINFALDNSKPFLAIYLEETELTRGLKLRMGGIQAIMKWRMTDQQYDKKMLKALPDVLRGPENDTRPQSLPTKLVTNRPKRILYASAALLAILTIAFVVIQKVPDYGWGYTNVESAYNAGYVGSPRKETVYSGSPTLETDPRNVPAPTNTYDYKSPTISNYIGKATPTSVERAYQDVYSGSSPQKETLNPTLPAFDEGSWNTSVPTNAYDYTTPTVTKHIRKTKPISLGRPTSSYDYNYSTVSTYDFNYTTPTASMDGRTSQNDSVENIAPSSPLPMFGATPLTR